MAPVTRSLPSTGSSTGPADRVAASSGASGGSGSRTTGLAAALLVVELGGLLAVRVRDPHSPGSWGGCPILALTGRPCPFCGGMRAAADLAGWRWAEALSENAMAVVAVVGGLVATTLWLAAAVRAGRRGADDPGRIGDAPWVLPSVVAGLVLWIGFGLVRLWPPLAWLQP